MRGTRFFASRRRSSTFVMISVIRLVSWARIVAVRAGWGRFKPGVSAITWLMFVSLPRHRRDARADGAETCSANPGKMFQRLPGDLLAGILQPLREQRRGAGGG